MGQHPTQHPPPPPHFLTVSVTNHSILLINLVPEAEYQVPVTRLPHDLHDFDLDSRIQKRDKTFFDTFPKWLFPWLFPEEGGFPKWLFRSN